MPYAVAGDGWFGAVILVTVANAEMVPPNSRRPGVGGISSLIFTRLPSSNVVSAVLK